MTTFFTQPAAQAIAWALVHFAWQGTLLGLVAYAVLRHSRLSATSKYGVGVAILIAMLAAPIASAFVLTRTPGTAPPIASGSLFETLPAVALNAAQSPTTTVPAAGALFEMAVLGVWLAGVAVLGIRLLGGWVVTRRLTSRSVRPVSAELESMARRVAGRLALETSVRVVESLRVAVPVLVGWVKPVVLLPAASLSSLTPTQIEALLAHELAHVRRHDYLVNMVQAVAETLLFYHPAVWWVSRQVRAEREHCCDDIAVGICDRLEYVSALASLAAVTAVPSTALAATDGSLVGRVRRLLAEGHGEPTGAASWPAAALVALLLVGGALLVPFGIRAGSAPATPDQVPVADARPRPEPAGVPGGVPGGVQGGVPGGVADAVRGGVPGGVPGGVAGGVDRREEPAEVIAGAVQSADARAREIAEQEARQRAVLALEREYREAQRRLELERLELALKQMTVESQLVMRAVEAEVEARRKELADTQRRVEVGLATAEAAAAVEQQLREAERQLLSARNGLESQQRDFDLQRKEVEVRAEYERKLAALGVRHELTDEAARSAEILATVEAAQRLRRDEEVALAARQYELAAREAALANLQELDAAAAIGEADVIVVSIAGEPLLPPNYTVGPDGTIRLPFLGAIPAAGRTAADLRDAIARELASRNLKPDAQVTVTVRRPRE